jgi:GAF domain-containing protein
MPTSARSAEDTEAFTNSTALIVDHRSDYTDMLQHEIEAVPGLSVETITNISDITPTIESKGTGLYYAVLIWVGLAKHEQHLNFLYTFKRFHPDIPVIYYGIDNEVYGRELICHGAYDFLSEGLLKGSIKDKLCGLQKQEAELQSLANLVCERLHAPLCILWGLDETRDNLKVLAWNGPLDPEYRDKVTIPYSNVDTYKFILTGLPQVLPYLHDPSVERKYQHMDEARKRNWQSLLTMPLMQRGRAVGLLDTYSIGEIRHFTKRDQQWVHAISNRPAAIIYNRLWLEQVKSMADIQRQLSTAYDLDSVLEPLLERVLKLAGADKGCFYDLNYLENFLKMRARSCKESHCYQDPLTIGEGIPGEAVKKKEIQYKLPDSQSDDRDYEIAVPLKRENVVQGVLRIASQRALDDADFDIIINFADSLAVALEQEKLSHYVRKVTRMALGADIDELFQFVVEALRDLTGMTVVLWVLDEDQKTLKVHNHLGLDDVYAETARTLLDKGSITGEALRRGEPVWKFDIQNDSSHPKFQNIEEAIKQGWRFFICLPLLGKKDQPLGSLSIYGSTAEKCSESFKAMLWTFATQVSIALFRKMTFERLSKVTDQVTLIARHGLKPVLELVAENAAELFGADYVAIYPYDASGATFYDRENIVIFGPKKIKVKREKPAKKELAYFISHVDEVVVEDIDNQRIRNESNLEGDFSKDDLLSYCKDSNFIREAGISSFVGISLKISSLDAEGTKEEVGIMYIDFCEPHQFSQEELFQIRLFARQVSRAIQSVHVLEGRQRERIRDIAALRDINKTILEKDYYDVIALIVEKTAKIMGADCAILRRVDEDGDYLNLQASTGRAVKAEALRIDARTLAGHVAQTGFSVQCEDASNCPHYTFWYSDVRSCMAAPLKQGDYVIGTIYVDSVRPQAFSEQYQLELLEILASQASFAIQLFEMNQEKASNIESFQSISDAIVSSGLDIQKVLDLIVEKAVQTTPGEYASLWLVEKDSGDLLRRAVHAPTGLIKTEETRIKKGTSSINMLAFEKNEPYISSDLAIEERFFPIYKNARSSMTHPIQYQDEVIGTLTVESRRLDAFRQRHIDLLGSYADQAAIAIEIARFVRDLQEQKEAQIQSIHRLSDSITQLSDIDTAFDLILDSMEELIPKMSLCEIRTFDSNTQFLTSVVRRGSIENEEHISMPIGHGITGWAAEDKETKHVPDVHKNEKYIRFLGGTCSEVAVPLLAGEEKVLFGVLNVEHPEIDPFSEVDVKLIEAVAALTVAMINRHRLDKENKELDELLLLSQELSKIDMT